MLNPGDWNKSILTVTGVKEESGDIRGCAYTNITADELQPEKLAVWEQAVEFFKSQLGGELEGTFANCTYANQDGREVVSVRMNYRTPTGVSKESVTVLDSPAFVAFMDYLSDYRTWDDYHAAKAAKSKQQTKNE